MQLHPYHLTYCTNIHPAESWEETAASLQRYIPTIKQALAPDQPLGIGLRLSYQASKALLQGEALPRFQAWLAAHQSYVFTLNGFPYGNFHHTVVKGDVHTPDWTTQQRLDYTLRLFDVLAALLPEGMDGGVSTSPLSYKPWHKDDHLTQVMESATLHIAVVAEYLYKLRQRTGQLLHLDIEPEPDGMLENTREVINFYHRWLIPVGTRYLKQQLGLSDKEAEMCLKEHIQLCYDVCHFAIAYEEPLAVFKALREAGIHVGKIQISAALKAQWQDTQPEPVAQAFASLAEPTYLHQVVQRDAQGRLTHFRDLPAALAQTKGAAAREWRTHFHVPVFLDSYGVLQSTQDDILKVLYYLRQQEVTRHLEVETYTWEVLPQDIQLPLADSIIRELQWVQQHLSV